MKVRLGVQLAKLFLPQWEFQYEENQDDDNIWDNMSHKGLSLGLDMTQASAEPCSALNSESDSFPHLILKVKSSW